MLLERRAEAERLRESIRVGVSACTCVLVSESIRVGVSTCTCVLVSYKKYCILILLERRVEAERLRESIRVC